MKKMINKFLREGLLDEDFNSSNELIELTEEIYIIYLKHLVKKDIREYNSGLPSIEVFKEVNLSQYEILNDFIQEVNLQLIFGFLGGNTRGIYNQKKKFIGISVGVTVLINELVELMQNTNKDSSDFTEEDLNKRFKDIYYKVYNEDVISTLLHELQHAYDDWRSNGKWIGNKRHSQYVKNNNNIKIRGSREHYNSYLKLPHEISSRFEQANKAISYFTMDWNGENIRQRIAQPWDKILNDFKTNFVGWDEMTPKIQKNLIRRLSQYYHKYGDEIKKYNQENK